MSMRLILAVGPGESSMHGLWLDIGVDQALLPLYAGNVISIPQLLRKEDHAMQYYFRFNRQRGPVNALQMRLQG
ncbi:hypothetical protein NE852_06025 [Rhizobium sp. Pop5]|uniref:hypothetical protein n=1 Tax=Rhizobium sp. Pop5 TaxID=1223565 RepID=UPI0002839825|nr:hypothetical protein [Rhizobium sp. Pop5]EJZ20618.1 hypothetical protein RCCGEPOP_14222 [Rhizobium sp. Pop5]UVD57763.1 hypothetical protein NE852_06025 [Rhizobium sp. Pop5]